MKNYDTAIREIGGLGNSFCSANCNCQAPEGFTNLQLNKYRNTKEATKDEEVMKNKLYIDNTNGAKVIHDC